MVRRLAGWRGEPVHPGHYVRGLADHGGVRAVASGVAVKHSRRIDAEQGQHPVRFGEAEDVLQGAPGPVRVAERVAAIAPSMNAAATQIRQAPGTSWTGVRTAAIGRSHRPGRGLAMSRVPPLARSATDRVGCLPSPSAAGEESLIMTVMSLPRYYCCLGRRSWRGHPLPAETGVRPTVVTTKVSGYHLAEVIRGPACASCAAGRGCRRSGTGLRVSSFTSSKAPPAN